MPIGIRVFGLGCRLAELIVGLRAGAERDATPAEAQRHIDQLNRDFGNIREVLQDADASLGAALLEPVVARFADDLNVVMTERPDLARQCESLADELRQLFDPPGDDEPVGEAAYDDVPF